MDELGSLILHMQGTFQSKIYVRHNLNLSAFSQKAATNIQLFNRKYLLKICMPPKVDYDVWSQKIKPLLCSL